MIALIIFIWIVLGFLSFVLHERYVGEVDAVITAEDLPFLPIISLLGPIVFIIVLGMIADKKLELIKFKITIKKPKL